MTIIETKANENNVALGKGFSTVGGPRQRALDGTTSHTGGGSSITINVCKDITSVKTTLDISANRNIDIPDIGGYSDRASFFKSLNLTHTSICIIVKASIESPTNQFDTATLKQDIQAPTTNKDIDTFCATYGDSYVSTITHGAQFFAVLKFDCYSQTEKTKVEAEIEASGIIDELVLTADYNAKFSNALSKIKLSCEYRFQSIGVVFATPGKQDVINAAFDFLKTPSSSLTGVLNFTLHEYYDIKVPREVSSAFQAAFLPVSRNREVFLGNITQTGLIAQVNSILETKNELAAIEKFYRYYGEDFDNATVKKQQTLSNDLVTYQHLVNQFNEQPSSPLQWVSLPSAQYSYPYISRTEEHSATYGGDDGQAYFDITAADFVKNRWYLDEIELRGDWYVDQISLRYRDPEGKSHCYTHGESGGNQLQKLTLSKTDFITKIIVSSNSQNIYVNYIKITTNENPDGIAVGSKTSEETEIFSRDGNNKNIFVGFNGRCARWNNAIAAQFMRLNDLKWG